LDTQLLRTIGLFAFTATAVFAQDAPPTPADATKPQDATQTAAAPAAAPASSPWTKDGIDLYVYGDVYGTLNFNHPASGYNQLYNFDDKANNAHLNFAKFSMEKASGILGFRVDVGVGRTVDIVGASDDAPSGFKYLEQMYVEFRPPKSHGIEIDFGKFVTTAGAEVIETNNNWNYSRSLLFAWAIPYYHFGARATIPVTKTFSTGVQLVNGWNSLGTNNGMQTVGLAGNFTWKKASWSNTYYTGPQEVGFTSQKSYRQLYDTVLLLTPNSKSNIYLNYDYGTDKLTGIRSNWTGFAAAARYQITSRFAFAPRAEVFDDLDGFSTGVKQAVKEVTLTGEMKIRDGLLSRLEFRRDMSDKPYFDRGAGVMVAKNQTTLALGFIAFFGPKK
jgi:hypothetical protein